MVLRRRFRLFSGSMVEGTDMKTLPILVLFLVFALAANPAETPSADGLFESGNAALLRGDLEQAQKRFHEALAVTPDPGQVSFNLGVLHFQRKEFSEAERYFTRSLDDAEAPTERRAKALYNRGVCLMHFGGLAEYRSAIDSFERCLKIADTAELMDDARQNLELSKLLWLQARNNAKEKPKPNDPSPNTPPEPKKTEPKNSDPPENRDPNGDPGTGTPSNIDPLAGQPKPNQKPKETTKTQGSRGNLPVRIDPETWRPANEEDAREFLKALGQRLAKDRRNSAEVHALPERADVKDW